MLALLTLCGPAGEALAQSTTTYVNIPAVAFTLGANTSYLSSFGAIQGDGADIVRAPVSFPAFGQRFCRITMWAHDDDVNDVTARLIRKRVAPDGSTLGAAPETIGSVSSSGAVDLLRRFDGIPVSPPVIAASYVYWVELEFGGGPIQVIGVRIQADTAC
jgi:hypothetical protein